MLSINGGWWRRSRPPITRNGLFAWRNGNFFLEALPINRSVIDNFTNPILSQLNLKKLDRHKFTGGFRYTRSLYPSFWLSAERKRLFYVLPHVIPGFLLLLDLKFKDDDFVSWNVAHANQLRAVIDFRLWNGLAFRKICHETRTKWNLHPMEAVHSSFNPTPTWIGRTRKVRPNAEVSRLCFTPFSTTSSTCGLYSRSWASIWKSYIWLKAKF